MKRIGRKYILIILAFLTTLLCAVGSSTWIILSEKTKSPSKRELITPVLSDVKITTPLFYGDTIALKDLAVTGTATETLADGKTRTIAGTYTVTSKNITSFSAESATTTTDGTGYTITNANNSATVQFTPTNTALYDSTTTTISGNAILVYAVAYYTGTSTTYYTDIDSALSTANNANTGSVYTLPFDYSLDSNRARTAKTINTTTVIQSGVTLLLPYELPTSTTNGTGTTISNTGTISILVLRFSVS